MEQKTYTVKGKHVTLYEGADANSPLIVFHNFAGDGSEFAKGMRKSKQPDYHLLMISNLQWDHDMTPWYCPPIAENDTPCIGGADEYLRLLLGDILPQAKEMLGTVPAFAGIAGYSLAGLFALYALYRCDAFDRAASMSGSLWFPDFTKFIRENTFQKRPERIYLSLGIKEAKTRNPFLQTVQTNTEEIAAYYRDLGLEVSLEMNPGTHYTDAEFRCAKGVRALLDERKNPTTD